MAMSEEQAKHQDGKRAEPDQFAFDIPGGVKEGITMKVMAPDGVELHIPLPGNVFAGDRMCMEKKDGTTWGIKHVIRSETPAAAPVQAPAQAPLDPARKTQNGLACDLNDASACVVALHTTRGLLKLRIVPMWAPLGAQRFMQLVTDRYYTDLAIYRAVPNFLVQFGVVSDPVRNSAYKPIKDDCIRGVPIEDGSVCFAAAGANTRTATICIFLGEYPQLGNNPWETPIGKVCPESMDVLHSIFTHYGDMPQCGGTGPNPVRLEEEGNEYITRNFPECDFVRAAEWLSPN